MITAEVASDRGLAARLTGKAARLAHAAMADRRASRSGDPLRWRKAGLLWPLFTRD